MKPRKHIDERAVIEQYQKGVAVKQICKDFKIHLNRLYEVLETHHIEKERATLTKVDLEDYPLIETLFTLEGLNGKELAQKWEVSENAMSTCLKRIKENINKQFNYSISENDFKKSRMDETVAGHTLIVTKGRPSYVVMAYEDYIQFKNNEAAA